MGFRFQVMLFSIYQTCNYYSDEEGRRWPSYEEYIDQQMANPKMMLTFLFTPLFLKLALYCCIWLCYMVLEAMTRREMIRMWNTEQFFSEEENADGNDDNWDDYNNYGGLTVFWRLWWELFQGLLFSLISAWIIKDISLFWNTFHLIFLRILRHYRPLGFLVGSNTFGVSFIVSFLFQPFSQCNLDDGKSTSAR